jgi:hypothetical protein
MAHQHVSQNIDLLLLLSLPLCAMATKNCIQSITLINVHTLFASHFFIQFFLMEIKSRYFSSQHS